MLTQTDCKGFGLSLVFLYPIRASLCPVRGSDLPATKGFTLWEVETLLMVENLLK